jgi:hypothetical protein
VASPKPKKKTAIPVVLTREEQIQRTYQSKVKDGWANHNIPEVPENRFLVIDEEVQIGNLDDCTVAWISDDRKFVVIDFTRTNNNYGNPILTREIGCWAWYDVYAKKDITATKIIPDKWFVFDTFSTSSIDSLMNKVLYFGTNSNPDYQRGYVWNEQDEINLIDSVFNGSDIGKFVFLKYEWPKTDVDVLDGKQRLNTLVRFITSQFSYKGLYWHQLSKSDRYKFEDRKVQVAELDANRFTEADKLRLFLQVNVAGVPQDESHLTEIRQKLATLEGKI